MRSISVTRLISASSLLLKTRKPASNSCPAAYSFSLPQAQLGMK
jgi:hypothetical protein